MFTQYKIKYFIKYHPRTSLPPEQYICTKFHQNQSSLYFQNDFNTKSCIKTIPQSIVHKDIFYSITGIKLLKHIKVLSQVIFNPSKNCQKFLHATF